MTSLAATPRAGSAVAAGERTSSRTWAWLGLTSFVLGVLVTWVIQFLIPQGSLEAGGGTLLNDLDTTRNEVIYRVSSGIGYITVATLIAFGYGFRRFLAGRMENSEIPNIVLGSILVTAAGLAIAMAFRAQVFDGITYYQGGVENHVALQRLTQDTVLASWAAMMGATWSLTFAGLRRMGVPKGIGWFSLVMSVLITLLCLVGGAFPANIPALLWLGVVSVWALRAK
jgi:hypothetical protein